MSGLLHRLAGRAAGTAVTARSDARLGLGGALVGGAGSRLNRQGGVDAVGALVLEDGAAALREMGGDLRGEFRSAFGGEGDGNDAGWASGAGREGEWGAGRASGGRQGAEWQSGRDAAGSGASGGAQGGSQFSGDARLSVPAALHPGTGAGGLAGSLVESSNSLLSASLSSASMLSGYLSSSTLLSSTTLASPLSSSHAMSSGASAVDAFGSRSAASAGTTTGMSHGTADGMDVRDPISASGHTPAPLMGATASDATWAASLPGAFPSLLMPSSSSNALAAAMLDPRVQAALHAVAQGAALPGASSAGTDTEITIHIGRIDVTAVRAPAAQPGRAAPAAATMSLDSYLTRRQRGGS